MRASAAMEGRSRAYRDVLTACLKTLSPSPLTLEREDLVPNGDRLPLNKSFARDTMSRHCDHSREVIRKYGLGGRRDECHGAGVSGLSARKAASAIGYTVDTLYLVFDNLHVEGVDSAQDLIITDGQLPRGFHQPLSGIRGDFRYSVGRRQQCRRIREQKENARWNEP
ncbi:MAG: hypothetical protein ABFS45_20785 [Pseudomonadota bacterium]